jgi:lysozyme
MSFALEIAAGIIKEFEGCRLEAYDDGTGTLTCGWGATGDDIKLGTVWTQQIADERLKSDILNASNAVKRQVKVHLSDKQAAALTSFVFNLGEQSLMLSTLLILVNQRDEIGASMEFTRWSHANGKRLKGLLIRRFKEAILFLQGS